MNQIHLPILTLIKRVEEMKVILDGLPLEYRARLINNSVNNDFDYIVDELQVIVEEVQTYVKEKENKE